MPYERNAIVKCEDASWRSSDTFKHSPVALFVKLFHDLTMASFTPKKDRRAYIILRSHCQRVDGKPKIVRTVYLGKIDDLVAAAVRSIIRPSPWKRR
jgi:hypothetical protein